ncbi:MAG: hypothetical protein WC314_23790 [Vulcanimicrobiota bacterium]
MNAHHDLLSYLQGQAGEGVKDSEGDFTISEENARKKLARFALPRETAWISKLLQAAVGWGMSSVSIHQSQAETQIFFEPPEPVRIPTEREVVNTLLSSKVVAETPLEHFCLGLRALVEQAKLSFLLILHDGDSTFQPIYAGWFFAEMTEQARMNKRFARAPGLTLTVRHTPLLTAPRIGELAPKHGLSISQELRDYAFFCPVPVVLGGLHLEGALDSPMVAPSSVVPLVFSGLNGLNHSPGGMPLPPDYEEKQFSFLTHPRRARRSYGGARDFSCAYLLTATSPFNGLVSAYRRSSFKWVRDGILIQESFLNVRTEVLSLHILADARGLKTDLTGFQMLQDDLFHQRRTEVLGSLAQRLREWEKKVDGFFREDLDAESPSDLEFDRELAYQKRVKRLLRGSVAGIALTLVNPPFGVAATLGGVASAYLSHCFARSRQVLDDQKLLKEKIERDLIAITRELERLAHEADEPVGSL